MVLTPQLRQRIEMLQMTSMELNELIEQELVANPILEEVLPGDEVQEISENILDQNADGHDENYANGDADVAPLSDSPVEFMDTAESYVADTPSENGAVEPGASEEAAQEQSDSFEEIDYGREFQDYLDPGYRTQEIEYKDDAPSFEQFLSHTESLSEHLEWQLHMQDLGEKMLEVCISVIGNLDADGRLTATVEELARISNCNEETVEKAR